MARKIIGYSAPAIGLAAALLATVGSASAAWQWDGAAVGPYGAYYDYAAGPSVSSPYYDFYGSDDYILARPAFPPGCGAGRPHC
jgi:hypothetical protein